jgi:hypothetical protein
VEEHAHPLALGAWLQHPLVNHLVSPALPKGTEYLLALLPPEHHRRHHSTAHAGAPLPELLPPTTSDCGTEGGASAHRVGSSSPAPGNACDIRGVEGAYTQQGRAHIRHLPPSGAARPALMSRAAHAALESKAVVRIEVAVSPRPACLVHAWAALWNSPCASRLSAAAASRPSAAPPLPGLPNLH